MMDIKHLINFLPYYFKHNDTYKDSDGKGILEKYLEIFGEYFSDVKTSIDNSIEVINIEKTSRYYLKLLWEMLGSIPFAKDIESLPFNLDDKQQRDLIKYTNCLLKIRGTRKFFEIMFRIYSNDSVSITPVRTDPLDDSWLIYENPGYDLDVRDLSDTIKPYLDIDSLDDKNINLDEFYKFKQCLKATFKLNVTFNENEEVDEYIEEMVYNSIRMFIDKFVPYYINPEVIINGQSSESLYSLKLYKLVNNDWQEVDTNVSELNSKNPKYKFKVVVLDNHGNEVNQVFRSWLNTNNNDITLRTSPYIFEVSSVLAAEDTYHFSINNDEIYHTVLKGAPIETTYELSEVIPINYGDNVKYTNEFSVVIEDTSKLVIDTDNNTLTIKDPRLVFISEIAYNESEVEVENVSEIIFTFNGGLPSIDVQQLTDSFEIQEGTLYFSNGYTIDTSNTTIEMVKDGKTIDFRNGTILLLYSYNGTPIDIKIKATKTVYDPAYEEPLIGYVDIKHLNTDEIQKPAQDDFCYFSVVPTNTIHTFNIVENSAMESNILTYNILEIPTTYKVTLRPEGSSEDWSSNVITDSKKVQIRVDCNKMPTISNPDIDLGLVSPSKARFLLQQGTITQEDYNLIIPYLNNTYVYVSGQPGVFWPGDLVDLLQANNRYWFRPINYNLGAFAERTQIDYMWDISFSNDDPYDNTLDLILDANDVNKNQYTIPIYIKNKTTLKNTDTTVDFEDITDIYKNLQITVGSSIPKTLYFYSDRESSIGILEDDLWNLSIPVDDRYIYDDNDEIIGFKAILVIKRTGTVRINMETNSNNSSVSLNLTRHDSLLKYIPVGIYIGLLNEGVEGWDTESPYPYYLDDETEVVDGETIIHEKGTGRDRVYTHQVNEDSVNTFKLLFTTVLGNGDIKELSFEELMGNYSLMYFDEVVRPENVLNIATMEIGNHLFKLVDNERDLVVDSIVLSIKEFNREITLSVSPSAGRLIDNQASTRIRVSSNNPKDILLIRNVNTGDDYQNNDIFIATEEGIYEFIPVVNGTPNYDIIKTFEVEDIENIISVTPQTLEFDFNELSNKSFEITAKDTTGWTISQED